MINVGIGEYRIVLGFNSRWENRVPDPKRFGDDKVVWTQRGAALAFVWPGYFNQRVRVWRLPYTRKVWTGAHKRVTS